MGADNLSIVISTFKREKQIIRILDSLNNQISDNIFLEINICDSYSDYNTNNFHNYKKNIGKCSGFWWKCGVYFNCQTLT